MSLCEKENIQKCKTALVEAVNYRQSFQDDKWFYLMLMIPLL
jgi:hypothetical protein